MPKTDPDPLGESFRWRLRAELNRITPAFSPPRYLLPARRGLGAWRLAPAGLAMGVAGILGLTAYAATGSPNPVVWTEQIVTKIEPNLPTESNPPTPPSGEPSEHEAAPAAGPSDRGERPTSRPGHTETPESGENREPAESPEPKDVGDPGAHGGDFGSHGGH